MTSPFNLLKPYTIDLTQRFTFANVDVTSNLSAGNASLGNLATANYFSGNGSSLHHIVGANITGQVSNALVSGTVYSSSQPNITTVGTLTSLNVTGNIVVGANITGANVITANLFVGSGASLTSLPGANVSGFVPNANVANTAYSVSLANVTGAGNLASVNKDGNASNILYGNGVFASAPVTYSNANVATFLANFGSNSISTTGNITAGNLITGGTGGNISGANVITANLFVGNGASLTSIAGANVTGTVSSATVAASANSVAGANVTGQVSFAATANSVAVANVSGIGNIATINKDGNASNILYGNGVFASAPVTYGNSNVATYLASFGSNTISTTGNITAGNLTVGGNLTVNGTLTSINSTIVQIDDLAIVLANDASSSTLANGAGIIINGANANILYINSTNSFTFSHKISADGGLLSNISGANVTGTVANATVAASANSVAGANVTGQVANALVAGTVYTNAQPNITSVGTLSSLNVTGNVTAGNLITSGTGGNISGANNISATGNISAGNILSDNLLHANGTPYAFTSNAGGANTQIQFNDGNNFAGNASLTFNKTTATLSTNNFTATGNVTLGAAANVHITGGTTGQYLKTDGAGNLSWATVSGGSGSGITYTAATIPPVSANVADQWYNTTTNTLYEYMSDGTSSFWVDIQTPTVSTPGYQTTQLSFNTRTYTGTGSQVNFIVSSNLNAASVLVTIDGVVQTPATDYNISGATLTFTSAPYSGSSIQIRELGNQVPYTTQSLNSLISLSAVTLTVTGNTTANNISASNITSSSNLTAGNLTVTGTVTSTALRAQSMLMGIIFGG